MRMARQANRGADLAFRIRGYPSVSGGEDRPVPAAGRRWTLVGNGMADVADGRRRPEFRPSVSFPAPAPGGRPGKDIAYGRDRYGGEVRRLCAMMDRRLSENAFSGGRGIYRRRYRGVSVGRATQVVRSGSGENAASAPLVRRYSAETRRQARHGRARTRTQSQPGA